MLTQGWLIAFGIGTPILSFGGAWLGGWLNRVSARETHARQRREETMRLFRWAADMAVSDKDRKRTAGISALAALQAGRLFESYDLVLLDALTDAVAALEESTYDQEQEGDHANGSA